MKNFILTVTRDIIPYVKGLRPITGSVTACIVMQQLDYWFARYPDGFYKFLEPCENKAYKKGDSWTEELGMSVDEFRTAFDRIGIRYTSKTAYMGATDKFAGKYYCSFFDKKLGVTYYFRNHELVDTTLQELLERRPSPVDGNPNLQEMDNSISRDGDQDLLGMDIPIRVNGNANPKNSADPISVTGHSSPHSADNPIPRTSTETTAENSAEKASAAAASSASLLAELRQFKVSAKIAADLVASDPDECRRQLEFMKRRKDIDAPAKFLVSAIREKYDPPAEGKTVRGEKARAAIAPSQAWQARSAPPRETERDAELRAAFDGLSEAAKRRLEDEMFSAYPMLRDRFNQGHDVEQNLRSFYRVKMTDEK